MVESKKAFPKEPRSMGLSGLYTNMSPPLNLSPGRSVIISIIIICNLNMFIIRFDNVNNNNNMLYNRYNALSHYYNSQTSTDNPYVSNNVLHSTFTILASQLCMGLLE